jgi:poly(ADP-ribose) glycohydrolase ARH3
MPRAHRDKGQGSKVEAMGMDWNGLRDRFTGSAIGTFIGDAMGRVVEGWPASAIRRSFGLLEDMTEGIYTDDTEMMMGIMESLCEAGWFDPSLTAGKFLHNFNPTRGYGGRIYGVMDRLRRGITWNQAGTDSWGNGSAMRVAPIGFFFHDDPVKLREAAIQSSMITHKHPKGIAGAVAQATAVGIATRKGLRGEPIEVGGFTDLLVESVVEIDREMADQLERIKEIEGGDLRTTIDAIGSHFSCDVSAIGAVPPAIASFLLTRGFKESVVVAVNCGGDTDTLGAMSGAIAGAYYGYGQIPRQWLMPLENEGRGRDYIRSLAERLAELKVRNMDQQA